PVDTVYLDSTGVCHIVGPGPTPTPTPTPTPCDPFAGLPCQSPTPTPTPTPNVVSVTFSQVVASSEPISQNPVVMPHNPGVGQRIFPDDDSPGDMTDRRLVRVSATLSQPVANVPVYFRNFDLDDPATDPIIDPMGTAGNDNNGMPNAGELLFANGCGANGASVHCPTDANGVARIDFIVTRQPGDNFAIAASTIPAQANAVNIAGIELTNGGGQTIPTSCPTQPVCRSQMLTVWRRLHIEVDSMGIAANNRVQGRIETTTRIRVGETRVVPITASNGTIGNLEVNRFEGGRMVANFKSLRVECNLTNASTTDDFCNNAASVNVRNAGGALITLIANTPFDLYDDDDFNNDDGTNVDGDTNEDIPSPDDPSVNATALMQSNDVLCSQTVTSGCNVFASTYVRPLYDITNDTTDNTGFLANIELGQARGVFMNGFDQRATENDQEFWTIVLYGAYQSISDSLGIPILPPGGLDGDPPDSDGDGNPDGCPEVAYGQADTQGPGGLGAGIFMEVLRPRESANVVNYPISPARTAAHEIGHLFGGDHDDHGLMDPSCGPDTTLMTGYIFDPRTIGRLRALPNP
ncbi:MAG: hypothetical protein ACRD6X_15820, partial [Pyrinomonadaceae bacterium]